MYVVIIHTFVDGIAHNLYQPVFAHNVFRFTPLFLLISHIYYFGTYNPGQYMWDNLPFMSNSCNIRSIPLPPSPCIRGGGEGRIWSKERLFPCEKRLMVEAVCSARVSHIIFIILARIVLPKFEIDQITVMFLYSSSQNNWDKMYYFAAGDLCRTFIGCWMCALPDYIFSSDFSNLGVDDEEFRFFSWTLLFRAGCFSVPCPSWSTSFCFLSGLFFIRLLLTYPLAFFGLQITSPSPFRTGSCEQLDFFVPGGFLCLPTDLPLFCSLDPGLL